MTRCPPESDPPGGRGVLSSWSRGRTSNLPVLVWYTSKGTLSSEWGPIGSRTLSMDTKAPEPLDKGDMVPPSGGRPPKKLSSSRPEGEPGAKSLPPKLKGVALWPGDPPCALPTRTLLANTTGSPPGGGATTFTFCLPGEGGVLE